MHDIEVHVGLCMAVFLLPQISGDIQLTDKETIIL